MITTRARILVHRNVPRTAAAAFRQHRSVAVLSRALTANLDTTCSSFPVRKPRRERPSAPFFVTPSTRFSSSIRGTVSDGTPTSHETSQQVPGRVTRTLRVLDMDVVRNIQEELRSVDVNSDGR